MAQLSHGVLLRIWRRVFGIRTGPEGISLVQPMRRIFCSLLTWMNVLFFDILCMLCFWTRLVFFPLRRMHVC